MKSFAALPIRLLGEPHKLGRYIPIFGHNYSRLSGHKMILPKRHVI
jgi:hypothetical protein